jgi:hypothetical protein
MKDADVDCFVTDKGFQCVARPGSVIFRSSQFLEEESLEGHSTTLSEHVAQLDAARALLRENAVNVAALVQQGELLSSDWPPPLLASAAITEAAVDAPLNLAANWQAPFSLAQDAPAGARVLCQQGTADALLVQEPPPGGLPPPTNAWSVGSDLAWRYPQAVLSAGRSSDLLQRPHFCCAALGCELMTVPVGTEGCVPALGSSTVGAAKAKCELGCSTEVLQELRPDAVCFEQGTCAPTRRAATTGLCYASREVCLVAAAQSAALQSVGTTYA